MKYVSTANSKMTDEGRSKTRLPDVNSVYQRPAEWKHHVEWNWKFEGFFQPHLSKDLADFWWSDEISFRSQHVVPHIITLRRGKTNKEKILTKNRKTSSCFYMLTLSLDWWLPQSPREFRTQESLWGLGVHNLSLSLLQTEDDLRDWTKAQKDRNKGYLNLL